MRGLVEGSEGSPPPEVQRILPATRHVSEQNLLHHNACFLEAFDRMSFTESCDFLRQVRHLLRENVPRSAQTRELRRLLRQPHVQVRQEELVYRWYMEILDNPPVGLKYGYNT